MFTYFHLLLLLLFIIFIIYFIYILFVTGVLSAKYNHGRNVSQHNRFSYLHFWMKEFQ